MLGKKSKPTRADLVVGIDFGMTCTGVAYVNLTRGEIIRTIQRWPGQANSNQNKVPTSLCYPSGRGDSNNSRKPSNWGFLSESSWEEPDNDDVFVDWFKPYLDESHLKSANARHPDGRQMKMEDIEKYYLDYLHCLYEHIRLRLTSELVGKTWETANIEFIFSVPTTWVSNTTVERFRTILTHAGYQRPNHSVAIGLTEAEAAAVTTSVDSPGLFKEDEVILVCDVGGATTDLAILRIKNVHSVPILEQLDVVFGKTIGAVMIDHGFEGLVIQRLKEAWPDAAVTTGPSKLDLEEVAWWMSRSVQYQRHKCDLGLKDETPKFSVPIPGVPQFHNNEAADISGGAMKFDISELHKLFDRQINRLFEMIDERLALFQKKYRDQVAHIVLSGGLGHNEYVRKRLVDRYGSGACKDRFTCAQNILVSVASEPQLAACKGLLVDRIQKLNNGGKGVLAWRCCRVSYGIPCHFRFDPKDQDHLTRPVVHDPYDGRQYITNGIQWLIKKGDAINGDAPICHQFVRKLDPEDGQRTFSTKILTSNVDPMLLPVLDEENVDAVCEIMSDLSGIKDSLFKFKNRFFWNRRKKYRRIRYTIKVIIGPADINFELYFRGRKISQDKPIQVDWFPAKVQEPRDDEDEIDNARVHCGRRPLRRMWHNESWLALASSISLPDLRPH